MCIKPLKIPAITHEPFSKHVYIMINLPCINQELLTQKELEAINQSTSLLKDACYVVSIVLVVSL